MTIRFFFGLTVLILMLASSQAVFSMNSKVESKAVKATNPKFAKQVKPTQPDKLAEPVKTTETPQIIDPVQSVAQTPVIADGDHLAFMQQEQSSASPEPSSSGLLIKTIGAMLLVVGLIFFAAWGVKKLGFGGPKTGAAPDDLELTILSTVSMGGGRTISTLRFGERVLLVGSTAESFTLLAEDAGNSKFSIGNSRSVADMLAEENGSFGAELDRAEMRFGNWESRGEHI